MAVESCDKQKEMDDLDEDDAPIVFKRNSSSSKQNQSNSETKKPLPQKHDQQLGRPALNERPQNGQNNSVQKSKMGPSSRTPPDRSPLRSPKLSNSPTQGLAVKSTNVDSIPSTSMIGELKSVKRPIKAENALNKSTSGPNEDSEDSEDDKPLSARFSKVNSGNANKGANALNSVQHSKIPKSEDSDDKLPLSSKFRVKSTTSAEKKPLLAKYGQNASNSGQNSKIPKSEDSDDKLPLSSKFRVKSTTSAEKKPLLAECGQNASDSVQHSKIPKSEDLDDKLPLSSKCRVKSTTNAEKKPLSAECGQNALNSGQNSKFPKSEDSDDMLPLSSKFRVKSTTSAEKKPLLAECGQNGSTSGERKPLTVLKKRNVDDVKPTDASSLKRPKLSDTSLHKYKESSTKAEIKEEDDEDHVPISQRMKKTSMVEKKSAVVKKMTKPTPVITKKFNKKEKVIKNSKYSESSKVPPSSGEGQKWTTLVHNGVIFPPPYKPHGVKILYKGKPVALTPEQEEVATMFAVMLDTEYMDKPKFKENFMDDWRKILGKNHSIQSLEHCDFTPIYEWHQKEKEKKKQMTTEEKKALKEEKLKQEEKYMWAVLDGVKEKVGNFRVEPPGLFRGRGEHPKMGKLKKRIRPSDITINIGRDAPIPECPIAGESWKEIRHDNTVTWLAYWNDPINPKEFKYVFLAASSSLKGQSDKEKYEKARLLKDYIQGIRKAYTRHFTSSDPTKKQIAVATYLIDKLALRAGNEKDDDEADTVGCCTLKVENVEPVPPNILKFDFLGKDSIRYQNEVEVEVAVFRAIQQFRTGKKGGDDMFDRLDTSKLNAHLKELMPGLTAKVFRTYNASITLDDMLNRETKGGEVAEKIVVYQHANKEVAIICNHQRTVSKSHSAQMTRLDEKIDELKSVLEELRTDLARAKKGKPPLKSSDGKVKRNLNPESLEKKISQTTAKIEKMVRDKETKEDLKTVALGTSKINYLDPRITVAWCKRHEVPIEKIFNKSLLAKFAWSMDVDPSFRF